MSSAETIIRLTNVTMQWDKIVTLQNISFDVNKGDFIAITGPNGGGKTTLLRIILKLLRPTSGKVEYLESNNIVSSLPIGYLPQKNMIDARFPVTVSEVIASGLLGTKNMDIDTRNSRIDDIITQMGLQEHIDKPIGTLSGGQLQRTLMGRALISSPEILVLDEPLSYVDKRFEHRLYEIVANLAGSTTILLVSHQMSTIAGMATRHFIVDHTLEECSAHHHQVHYDCETP
ncbi:MAG: ATP-binding cassette domain-containing protein [Muribaculaceae bacterium]|nr:ATP-binding cassette domain-containing protein [Muribaculaceae bacterium]